MISLLGAGVVWSVIVIRLWDGQSGVHILIWARHFTLPKKSTLALGPTLHFIQWLPAVCCREESCNRPVVAQRVPGGLGSQIFMTFST